MLKHLILLTLIFIATTSYAVNCPSVSELQNLQLQNWQAFTSDNGTPLNMDELRDFSKEAREFVMAEWAEGAPEGEAHCYYINQSDVYTSAFLAQKGLQANKTDQHWFKSSGFDRCVENDPTSCPFSAK